MESKDLLISHYNRKYQFETEREKKINKIMINKFPRDRYEAAVHWGQGSGRALEIGAGSGSILLSLRNCYEEYVATELSSERIKYLRGLCRDDSKVTIVHDDIEEKKLNFPHGYFDTILMVHVIEHLIEPISVLKYCNLLLKPGGRLLIDTPNIAKWTRRLKLFFGFFPSTASLNEGLTYYGGRKNTDLFDEGHLHYFTYRSLRKLLIERCDFSAIYEFGYGNFGKINHILRGILSNSCFLIAVK